MRNVHTAEVLPYGPASWRGFFERTGPIVHALLRIGAALLFMQHGAQKLLGWFGGFMEPGATAPLMSQMGLAGVLELFGGLLILFGFLTVPVALILVVEMVAAYVIAHMPQGGFPVENQGELALLYALVFLFLFGNGAGPLSLDHWLARRRAGRATPTRPAAETAREMSEPPAQRGRHNAA